MVRGAKEVKSEERRTEGVKNGGSEERRMKNEE